MGMLDVALFGVAVAAVSSLATAIALPRGVSREEFIEVLDKHMEACRIVGQVRDKADEVRNGRIERLENMAATKADLACLRQDLIDRIDRLERILRDGRDREARERYTDRKGD